jgi:hypothetical protein
LEFLYTLAKDILSSILNNPFSVKEFKFISVSLKAKMVVVKLEKSPRELPATAIAVLSLESITRFIFQKYSFHYSFFAFC